MQLVVPSAVRNAVSAATITFTASSMIRCFFIISSFLFCHTDSTDFTDFTSFGLSFCHTEIHGNHRNFTSSGLSFVTQKFTEITEIFTSSGLLLSTEIKEIIASLSVRSLCRRHFP